MNCPNMGCGAAITRSSRICVGCGSDLGAPNVRAANEPAEVSALGVRYSDEISKSQAGAYHDELVRFVQLAAESKAIMCMPASRLLPVASDPHTLISTYGLQVEAEVRVPLDNRFDNIRASVEEAYFPNYSKEIRFAALSLSDTGQIAYGACSITLKDSSISARTSVFEFPLFQFAETKKLGLSQAIPAGHRADWLGRCKLAAVKLGPSLKGCDDKAMAELLLPRPEDTISDCIEVHIFGPLNRHSMSSVVLSRESRREDILLQQAVAASLSAVGIAVRFAE